MKNYTYILLLAITFFAGQSNAQDIGLNIGSQLPDFKIEKIINLAQRTANTADFKNQLLIIDFWATSCSGCVAALPHMEALQKQFGSKIKILPVTYEKEAQVIAFWKNNKYTKNLTLPSVVEDKVFEAYFKHNSIPHEVWVYKGKVIGITGPDYVDAKNIQRVLNGEQINWPVKNDFYVFDRNKPLFKLDPNQIDTASTFIKYAAISDYKEGVSSTLTGGSGIVRDTKKKTIRTYFINYPIYTAYIINWMNAGLKDLIKPNSMPIPQFTNEVVWEVADKSKYQFDPKLDFQQQYVRDHGICFESVQNDEGQSDQAVYKSAIKNLDRLLGLNVRWEKRKEKVLVLVKTSADLKLSPPSVSGITVFNLKSSMNQQAANPYVFDETGYTGQGTLNIKIADWTDINAIRKVIAPYGLTLKEEERLVDKFVFSEINGGLMVDAKMMDVGIKRKTATKDLKYPSAEDGKTFLEEHRKKPAVITLPSGLQYKIIQTGTGLKPALTDKVAVNYTGMLVNGKIFDSSYEKGRAHITTPSGLIKGWTEALQLMPVGSKWEIYIPADLAYGGSEDQPGIPANSVLIFELELLSINK